jgi:hypothetical protein
MEEYISGVPTMIMLPARNYKFKVVLNECEIRIPREGKYEDIDPEFFNEESGSFVILDDKSLDKKLFFFPSITKVLFACKKYPDLPYNQVFAPVAAVIEETDVIIYGQVLEFADLEFAEKEI